MPQASWASSSQRSHWGGARLLIVAGTMVEVVSPGGPSSSASADPSLEFLWEQYGEQLRARRDYEDNGVDVDPEPGFAVKTALADAPDKVGSFACRS